MALTMQNGVIVEPPTPVEEPTSRPVRPGIARLKAGAASAALVLFGIVLALVIFEVFFRLLTPLSVKPVWRDLPKEYYLPQQSHSSRDYDYSKVKPANTYRIMVVGDSFTYGGSMQIFDTFPKRLERYLNLNEEQPRVEVINYSVPGFATIHEERLVRRAIEDYQADLVLLQFTLNDVEPIPYRVTHGYQNRRGQVQLKSQIFRYWKSLGFIATRIINTFNNKEYKEYYFRSFDKPGNWKNMSNSLRRMTALAREQNVKFAAVIFPLFSSPLDEDYPFQPLHQRLHREFETLGIPFMDLFPAYRNIPHGRLEAIPGDDPHPNEIAHRIAADYIFRFLRHNQLIPKEAIPKQTRHRRRLKHKFHIEELNQGSGNA